MKVEAVVAVLRSIEYPGLEFVFPGDYLQVRGLEKDHTTGEMKYWNGRKWRISAHMTKSEIVQTAFKAVMTWVEHEAREKFLYKGAAIFGPHFDVDQLATLAQSPIALDVRENVE